MTRSESTLTWLYRELKRRRVFATLGVYAGVSFVAWQVAEIGVPALGLPSSVLTAVVLLTLLGFPVVLAVAWLFRITPEGLRRHEAAGSDSGPVGAGSVPRVALVGLAAALVVLVGGVWLAGGSPPSGFESAAPGPTDADRLAVFPFTVRGSGEVADLGEGMADLLTLTLDGAGELTTVDNYALLGRLRREGAGVPDLERAREVATSFRAGLFVLGSVVELGDRLEMTASLYRSDGTEVARARRSAGSLAGIHDVVDGISQDLIRAVPEAMGVRAARLDGLTTRSLDALKAYLAGEARYRRADYRGAMEALKEAVAIDSAFALAHYRLALAATWNGDDLPLGRTAIATASRLSSSLTDRDRRLVEALRSYVYWDWGEAERRFRAAAGLYPDDIEAVFMLGDVLYHSAMLRGGRLTDGRPYLERVLELSPEEVEPMFHMATIENAADRPAAAIEILDRHLRLAPDGQLTAALRIFRQVLADERDAALDALRETDELNAFIAAFYMPGMGGFDPDWVVPASEVLAGPERSDEMRSIASAVRAHMSAAHGRWAEALRYAAAAGESDPPTGMLHEGLLRLHPEAPSDPDGLRDYRARLRTWNADAVPPRVLPDLLIPRAAGYPLFRDYLLGLTAATLGEKEEALRIADRLQDRPATEASSAGPADLARAVRAEVARLDGRPEEALRLLAAQQRKVQVFEIFNSPPFGAARERYLQGVLLRQLGDPAGARRWFEGIGDASFFKSYWPSARLALAEIAAEQGRDSVATAEYARVLRTWADPEPSWEPRVEAVRAALASLTSR